MAHPTTTHTWLHPRSTAITLALALVASAGLVAAVPVRAAGGDGLRQEANVRRAEGGLAPVVGTPLLDDIATHRAAQMAASGEMVHNMDYVFDRLNSSGVCWSGFGEIIAWNSSPDYSYAYTMNQWWDSDLHHKILMTADYNAAGGAWKASDTGNYSVMIFAVLCGSSIASEPIVQLHPERKYDPDRRLVFLPGTVVGYRLSGDGDVLATKTVRVRSITGTTAAGRARVNGRAWIKVSGGALAGYWVRETPNAYVRGLTQRARYNPDGRLALKAGRYVGLDFNWMGSASSSRRVTVAHRVFVDSSSRDIINGRPYFLVSSGRLAGYWVADTDTVATT